MRGARRSVPLLVALALGGCTMPRWNPAWVPAWVPLLGADRGEPPPYRPTQPPRVVERGPPNDDEPSLMERVVAVVNNDAITLGELEEAMAAARADARQRPPGTDEQIKREEAAQRQVASRSWKRSGRRSPWTKRRSTRSSSSGSRRAT